MIDLVRPRWWIAAAGAALALGVVALYVGWSQWGPIALLAGEILAILAIITITTPSISTSLAMQQATASRATPGTSVEQHEADSSQDEILQPNE